MSPAVVVVLNISTWARSAKLLNAPSRMNRSRRVSTRLVLPPRPKISSSVRPVPTSYCSSSVTPITPPKPLTPQLVPQFPVQVVTLPLPAATVNPLGAPPFGVAVTLLPLTW
ncbi:Uncharacterised protein [Klebsiella pneumoniae]|nr:hypothetical protein BN889_05149 [Pseudomonas aeruginosa PA38182]SAJ25912.1 Uncharacterised protein [Enterobacter cloacae]SVJ79272.1 Uncharacterised protein [Klebsiella pneumoniae]